jgi:hypothetical protein
MTFLPIAARELRVASRKRSTFWVRVTAAVVAVVIGMAFMVMAVFSFGMFGAGLGRGLFATLTWLSLAAVLSAGLFFTSDCLSEEKREGTIGFLFLTDLKGFDVVFGKLAATSLRGFYAFIAIFPILAVTLLMGGVTGGQFWKAVVALLNALFLSLTVGLFVSAFSRDAQKALGATLAAMVLLSATGPLVDLGISEWRGLPFQAMLSLSSPVYLFAIASAWTPAPFWTGLAVNQIVGWGLLGLTAVLLPRAWQEKARSSNASRGLAYRWKFGGVKRRMALRRKLLAVNPVLWLTCRERWQATLLWMASLGTAATAIATIVLDVKFGTQQPWRGIWMVWSFFGGLVTMVLYVVIASQASRFFLHAKRSGLLELLLATPLSVAQIIHGQWRALLRMFGIPILLYLAAQLLATVMAYSAMEDLAASIPTPPVPAPPATVTNVAPSNTTVTTPTTTSTGTVVVRTTGVMGFPIMSGNGPGLLVIVIISLGAVVTMGASLVALWWFGMWMGLTSKSPNIATLKTLLFVQIIPWFAISFAVGMLTPMLIIPSLIRGGGGAAPSMLMTWFPLLSSAFTTLLALAKDIGFILWSRKRLHAQLRDRAADIPSYVLPPVIPQPAAPVSATPA